MNEHKTSCSTEGPQPLVTEHNILSLLLLSLVFLLLVVPIAEAVPFADTLLRVGTTAVLATAAIATRRRRSLLMVSLTVAAIVIPLNWATLFVDQPYFFALTCALESLFLAVMAVVILVAVMRKHLATVHSIFGAVSAYLLLGLAWAVMYSGLDRIDEQALNTATPMVESAAFSSTKAFAFSQFIYFSFVTMSTLGYGDITPQTSAAQTLTWMQSVTGQFYIAVIVAWLVSEIPSRKHGRGEVAQE